MVGYWSCRKRALASGRGKEIRERVAVSGERQENAKKILNRGNKLEDLLKTQDLAFFRVKNKLVFECKKGPIKPKKVAKNPPLCPITLQFDTPALLVIGYAGFCAEARWQRCGG
jgi:hypothetical protein